MSICMCLSLCYLHAPKIVPSFYICDRQPVPARLLEGLSLAGSAIPRASRQKLLFCRKCETHYPIIISFPSLHQPFLLINNHIEIILFLKNVTVTAIESIYLSLLNSCE